MEVNELGKSGSFSESLWTTAEQSSGGCSTRLERAKISLGRGLTIEGSK